MTTLSDATRNVSLARMTTLSVGGRASLLVTPMTEAEAVAAIREVADRGEPLHVIGGGSNLLVSDAGVEGVVLQSADYTIDVRRSGRRVRIDVGAGVEWDELVAFCVAEGFAGVECLSGIPGKVGAAPIQNIGAYGQEVASVVARVRAIDRATGEVGILSAAECGFGYRTSAFKREGGERRFVSQVTLELTAGGNAIVAYPELARELGVREGGPTPPIATVRDAVLRIRRGKSMVYDPDDPNHRSAGSFFTNPIVDEETLHGVYVAADGLGLDPGLVPRFPADGGTKLSAAWLIERAGFERGFAFGAAGLSTNHCLAVVNRGTATANDIVALAAVIRRRVRAVFGVTLVPEPVFLGFDRTTDELLG